ncbi:MAG TPA: electron transfer flavoprotein subunit alpha/FixB family protein [Longimicrobiales bacterium]|nr:electron transfer flavoprotein subunit alpha/FixB family protein [Longimicrobiales bacterium]
MASILAVAEQRDGTLRKISEEVIAAANAIAQKLDADVQAKAFVSDKYSPEAAADAIVAAVKGGDYAAVIFGGSSYGKDLAPRVAAKLDVPLATDATAIDVEGSDIVVTRPVYGGRALAKVVLDGSPRVISIRPNAFRAAGVDTSKVESLNVTAGGRVVVREMKAAAGAKTVDVGEAGIVVSGGRGLKSPENWHLLEELRDALGANCALGASRAVVDAGWRPHAEQVGQTGKTVSPQLYFAIGISGAMQHLAGMRSAKTIVAINKDPDAPIFKIADYGIVGDATEILPRLTEELKK